MRVTTPNYDYFYLCPELRRKRMIPVLTRVRAKSIEEFGELVRHSGEEYIHVLEGRAEVHTEFYDPIVLEAGESVYIDSNMGHAYIAAEGCEEALLLGVCSSADEQLMESLLHMHDESRGSCRGREVRRQSRAGSTASDCRVPATRASIRSVLRPSDSVTSPASAMAPFTRARNVPSPTICSR